MSTSAFKDLQHLLSTIGRYKYHVIIAVSASAILVSSIILQLFMASLFNSERFFTAILYVCSAVIQAYAALITIPFTIAVVHLQSRYGHLSTEFLLKYSLRVFIIFGAITSIAVLTMLLASMGFYEHNPLLAIMFTVLLIGISLLPLPFVVNLIKSLFTLRPSEIADSLIRDVRLRNKQHSDMYKRLEEVLPKTFLLAGLCILDPSLEPELREVATRIATFFNSNVTPLIRKITEQPNDGSDNRSLERVRKELLPVIFKALDHYIVNYLKHSKNRKPLVDHEHLLPILNAVNDMLRVGIAKGIIHVGREYCYFVNSLREIMSVYIDEGRIGAALEIFKQVYSRLLKSDDDTLDLQHIQRVALENPRSYEERLPSNYDFYIDYASTILCTTFELLLEKLPRNSLRKVGSLLLYQVAPMFANYPILLAGYSFTQPSCKYSNGCVDAVTELILEQDEVFAPHLLSLLIAWMLKAYIMAEKVLNDDDKDQVLKNIRALRTAILGSLRKRDINVYAMLYPGELKLVFNGYSVPLSEYIYSGDEIIARLVSSYDTVKLCQMVRQVVELETKYCN